MKHMRCHISFLMSLTCLLAFVVQACIPLGFMPGQNHDNKLKLVICTSDGLTTQYVDVSSGGPDEDTGHESDRHCPYAPVLTKAETAPPSVISARISYITALPQIADAVTFTTDTPKPWTSQAPPVSSIS